MIESTENRFDRIVRRLSIPVAGRLAKMRFVSADRITYGSLVFGGLVSPVFIFVDRWLLAATAFVVADFADYVDGDVARAQGTGSDRGDILDGIVDRYVDFLILLAMTLRAADLVGAKPLSMAGLGRPSPWFLVLAGALAIFGAIMPSYVRAVAAANGRSTPESVGGRGTRTKVTVLALLSSQPAWGLIVVGVLANVAAAHRAFAALRSRPSVAET